MLLKRIELLLDPRIKDIEILIAYEDGHIKIIRDIDVKDVDRIRIYEGVSVTRRELDE